MLELSAWAPVKKPEDKEMAGNPPNEWMDEVVVLSFITYEDTTYAVCLYERDGSFHEFKLHQLKSGEMK